MTLGPPLCTMDWYFNLTGTIQAKISIVLTGNIYFFQLWRHLYLWRHITAKVEPRSPKSFSKKWSVLTYLSIEVYINYFCWHWFLTLFESGRFETPVKFWLWALKLKNRQVEHQIHYQSRTSKKMFLDGISKLSIMVWPTKSLNWKCARQMR